MLITRLRAEEDVVRILEHHDDRITRLVLDSASRFDELIYVITEIRNLAEQRPPLPVDGG